MTGRHGWGYDDDHLGPNSKRKGVSGASAACRASTQSVMLQESETRVTLAGRPEQDETASSNRQSRRENRFFLPPLETSNIIRASRSLGAGLLRESYWNKINIKTETNAQETKLSGLKRSTPPPRPTRSLSRHQILRLPLDIPSIPSLPCPNDTAAGSSLNLRGTHRDVHGLKSTLSTLALCSPPYAIDPLPLPVPHHSPTNGTPRGQGSKPRLKEKKSSPFLTASNSLRGLFRRDHVSPHQTPTNGGGGRGNLSGVAGSNSNSTLRAGLTCISDSKDGFSGFASGSVTFRGTIISPPVDYSPQESPEAKDRARREAVLRTALSHSLREKRQPVHPMPSTGEKSKFDILTLSSFDPAPLGHSKSQQLDRQVDLIHVNRDTEKDVRVYPRRSRSSFGRMLGEIGRDETVDSLSV